MFLYGDLASGFFYEARRNGDFCSSEVGCTQRKDTSVFKYRREDNATEDWLDTIDYDSSTLSPPGAAAANKSHSEIHGSETIDFLGKTCAATGELVERPTPKQRRKTPVG